MEDSQCERKPAVIDVCNHKILKSSLTWKPQDWSGLSVYGMVPFISGQGNETKLGAQHSLRPTSTQPSLHGIEAFGLDRNKTKTSKKSHLTLFRQLIKA